MQARRPDWRAFEFKALLPVSELKIVARSQPGQFALRCLGAWAMLLACRMEAMLEALRQVRGLPHRLPVGGGWQRTRVTITTIRKPTNVGAHWPRSMLAQTSRASGIDWPAVEWQGADFAQLRQAVFSSTAALSCCLRDAQRLEESIAGSVPVLHVDSLDTVSWLRRTSRSRRIVLLSPALCQPGHVSAI